MQIHFCFDLYTDIAPQHYTRADVVVLLFYIAAAVWLTILTVIAALKHNSRRLEWVDVWPLLGMNVGAMLHITAVVVSNGILVGIPFFDRLRNIHCSLWDYWVEFFFGFNVWFCCFSYITTKECVRELMHSGRWRDNAGALAGGIVCFLVFIIAALCCTAEITGVSAYNPALDMCLTTLPLKIMMICYAAVCATYVVVLALLTHCNYRYGLDNVLVPLRTIALLGLSILVALMVINLLNLTVFPYGRLAACMLVVILYLFANTTFYLRVLRDILNNKNELVVSSEMELEDFERTLETETATAQSLSLDHISEEEITDISTQPGGFYIDSSAYAQEHLSDIMEIVNRASMHKFEMETDEYEEDFVVYSPSESHIRVSCSTFGLLVSQLKRMMQQQSDSTRKSCFDAIVGVHFPAAGTRTIPLPEALNSLICENFSNQTAKLFQDTAVGIVLVMIGIYRSSANR